MGLEHKTQRFSLCEIPPSPTNLEEFTQKILGRSADIMSVQHMSCFFSVNASSCEKSCLQFLSSLLSS